MVEAVAFDFDGVLVGIETHTEARLEAFKGFAQSTGDQRFIADNAIHQEAHLHGSHPNEIIGWVLKKQGLIDARLDAAEDPLTHRVVSLKNRLYLSKISEGLDAIPGSLACVDWASEKYGANRVAIVTTASRSEVIPFINRHRLSAKIGVAVTKEDTPGKLKPDPLAYTKAALRFVLDPTDCVAIEDSVRGLRSAKSAGFIAIGITTTHARKQLRDIADYVVDNFEEIPRVIGSL